MIKNKFKVGDKVLLKNKRGKIWNQKGKMDCYMGKVVTISEMISDKTFYIKQYNKQDSYKGLHRWVFDIDDIERKVNLKHFKSLPKDYTGTIEIENGFIVEKEILDDVEKEYLRALIKPFRNRVIGIKKVTWDYLREYIIFYINGEPSITLPFFKKYTMYKGMELDKDYILEELGL